jgi:hypothetical protein
VEWALEPIATVNDRTFLVARTPSLAVSPTELRLPAPYFVCLVIANGDDDTSEDVAGLARHALDQGMVYCSAWGPGCEVVDDVVDWIVLERDEYRTDGPPVLTTWHAHEALDEALAFFVNATPAAEYRLECRSWLLVEDGDFGRASGSQAALIDHLMQLGR